MKKVILIVMVMFAHVALNAQFPFDNHSPNFNPNFQLGGFLHPDKVKMNQSMSFSSGMASNGLGFYESAFTNHLKFDLSDNLKFNVDISYVNFGTMTHESNMNFNSNKDNQGVIIPAFSLEFKPSTNTTIWVEYKNIQKRDPFFYRGRHDWIRPHPFD